MKREHWGMVVLASLVLLTLVGPLLSGHDANTISWDKQNLPPSWQHWFGTDNLGRDVWVRTFKGGRLSLLVGILGTLVSVVIGAIWGAASAMAGGRVDRWMMHFVDVLYGIPFMYLVILFVTFAGRGLVPLFLALGLVQWLNVARIVRGEVLSLKQQEFMQAARALGVGFWRAIFHHLMINLATPILACATLMVPTVMMEEAFLSFLGLGVMAPQVSWGSMIQEGVKSMDLFPWQIAFPGVGLFFTLLAFQLLGDGWRQRFEVKAASRFGLT